ncbi:MAG: hypothetical protein ACRCXZ_04680 [Patescibacteria group bacterium]
MIELFIKYKMSFFLVSCLILVGLLGFKSKIENQLSTFIQPNNEIELTVEFRIHEIQQQLAGQQMHQAIYNFYLLDKAGQVKYDEGVNQRIACAERVHKILMIIDPSTAQLLKTNKNLAESVYKDIKKSIGSDLTEDPKKVKNLALTIYFDKYEGGKPVGIGHVGLLFKNEKGQLLEVSNSSSFKTKIHNSFQDAKEWYSRTYKEAAILPIK